MVMFGVDVHKDSHTVVGVDEVGRQVAVWVSGTRDADCVALIGKARAQFPDEGERIWAVEDCRHVSRRLEAALLDAGERCLRVPPKLMAGTRRSARTCGKSDPIDALAIARAALAEPDLPSAERTGPALDAKLLVDHRDDLVQARTRAQCRLRWHLHDLDPDLEAALPARALAGEQVTARLTRQLARMPQTVRVRIARDQVRDIIALTRRIKALDSELAALATAQAPALLQIPGCGPLTATKIVGETGGIARFRSEPCFAMHAGAAPIPASSGRTTRHRLARGGNRQLNLALHRIAVTQIRLPGPGRDYYQRRRHQGDSAMEALRALKRKIARRVYNALRADIPTTQTTPIPAAA